MRWLTKDNAELATFAAPFLLSKSKSWRGCGKLASHAMLRQKKWVTDGKLRIAGEASLVPVNFSSRDLPPEVFSKEPEFVTFLLADGSKLHFDKRLVVERSKHFANMLSSETWVEGRTNVIDLRSNEQADVTSMQAVPWLKRFTTGWSTQTFLRGTVMES